MVAGRVVGPVSQESRGIAPNLHVLDLFARQAGRCQVLAPRIREEIRPIVARDDAVPLWTINRYF